MNNKEPPTLMPIHKFARKFVRTLLIGLAAIALSLFVGMSGYHYLENLSWLDAYLNAAMILSGMGPVATLQTPAGKFFAGTYALFSGILFLVITAFIFAPVIRRFLHLFHIEENKKD